jgi:exopolysaccharide biosynthesis WecB/TagA/CpsF family protein
MLDARGASLFLLGGQDGVPQAVAHAVQARWPNLRVAGLRHGFFTPAEEGDVVRQVRDSGADVLLVARGVPMQDLFIDRHLPFFGVKFAMGVGGLFDFVSGRINRAPRWMRDCGLEWVYRLMQEPGRMWQRYLVGNVTFLGRVALQRLGLRRGADDLQAVAPAAAGSGRSPPPVSSGVRAVVFATDTVGADLPALPDLPAALLPLGHASFLERCMETLAQASIVDVDLVVSHRPEALRQQVGNGQRWGLRVRWHLVRDAEHSCEVLRLMPVEGLHRIVIGHASQWIEPAAMQQLANHERTAMTRGPASSPDADEAPRWAGWATVAPERLQQLGLHASRDDLHRLVMPLGEHLDSAHWLWLDERQCAQAGSAAALLQAQRTAVGPDNRYEVPASWVRTPWGGMSPSARLHPTARLEGPVLIGPGCFVGEGASIGPHVVLTRDVVVSAGTLVRDSVVLPETLLGSGLDFSGTVVTGNRITHLALGVKSVLPPSDGLLLDLSQPAQAVRVSLRSRGLAGLGLVLLAPVLLPDLLLRRVSGAAPRWQASAVITGRDDASGQWQQARLRCPQQMPGSGHALTALLALGGPLLDVLQGRRAWFGMRPRDAQTWQQLSPDWQALLSQAPVGVFHAPAWSGDPDNQTEAEAAADAFQAVEHGAAANLRTVMAVVDRRLRSTEETTNA